MRRLASFVAIFVLLATAAPVLACVPGALRVGAARSCCHAMPAHCNGMASAAPHQPGGTSCCIIRLRSTDPAQLPATTDTSAVAPAVVSDPVPFFPPAPARALSAASRLPQSYLPPGLLSARSAVLRI